MKDNELYPKGIGLSEFVKAKRREQGWTQVQLADLLAWGFALFANWSKVKRLFV